MNFQGTIYISPQYVKSDYLSLNLTPYSSEDDWNKATLIFRDRIACRFLNQINALLKDVRNNSFAIMALNCLLIETLLQFRDGKDETSTQNTIQYSNFLSQEFPDVFTYQSARAFYRGIRCGILHSAQTKERTRLSSDESYIINYNNGVLEVSVKCFSHRLQQYFEDYIVKVSNVSETVIRANFIAKMDFICNR